MQETAKFLGKNFAVSFFIRTFAPANNKTRAFSSAGLEHLPYKQRVGGSNPSTPTTQKARSAADEVAVLSKKGRSESIELSIIYRNI